LINTTNIIKAANVYIMREIYNIVKSKKIINEKFVIIDGKAEGGKSRYDKWYRALGLDFGKNKTKRILDSALTTGKSEFTNEEIKILVSKTNIDSCYFTSEANVLMHIINMDIDKWKVLFQNIKEKKKQVNGLLELTVDSFMDGEMDDSEIVYRLIYYYINGKAYCNERRQDIILEKIKAVVEVKPSDWIQCSDESINGVIDDLESTLSFLRAYTYYRNAMNIENVKICK